MEKNNIYNFYNTIGWKQHKNITKDSDLFEDHRKNSQEYVKKCRQRINKYIPIKGDHILDFASGPIQYKEYLEYSKNFKFRHCVDFSKEAISLAKKKLKKRGKYYCEDFLKIHFKKNFFDCIISLHTIYHIDKSKQKKTIEKLIEIAKPGAPIIIVYSNPNCLIKNLIKIVKIFLFNKNKNFLYFHTFPNSWWFQFNKFGNIQIHPWRSFSSQHQKLLFPDNFIGKTLFRILFFLEDRFKKFFSKYFQYNIIIITKNLVS